MNRTPSELLNRAPLAGHEWTLIWAAMRYFMPRETIAASTFPALVVNHYYDRMNGDQRESLARDIREHLERGGRLGDERIDALHWNKLLAALDGERHELVKLTDGTEGVVFRANGRVYPLDEYIARPYAEVFIPEENIEK